MDWLQPCLQTARLELRALVLDDAPAFHLLVDAPEVAATTLLIPHPYPLGGAEEFIVGQEMTFAEGRGATFGIFERESGRLCGCTGLGCYLPEKRAELGYWLGVDYWGRGYATEAAARLLAFGFAFFQLEKIEARAFVLNPASIRVLEKIGMEQIAVRPRAVYKEGRGFLDVADYCMRSTTWASGVLGSSAPSSEK